MPFRLKAISHEDSPVSSDERIIVCQFVIEFRTDTANSGVTHPFHILHQFLCRVEDYKLLYTENSIVDIPDKQDPTQIAKSAVIHNLILKVKLNEHSLFPPLRLPYLPNVIFKILTPTRRCTLCNSHQHTRRICPHDIELPNGKRASSTYLTRKQFPQKRPV